AGRAREVRGMAGGELVVLGGVGESLERVLANDLEHREAPLVRAGVGDEALVRKRAEDRQHVLAVAGTDRLGGVERPAAGKGGEAGEEAPLAVGEKLVAGGDRGSGRAGPPPGGPGRRPRLPRPC